MQVFLPYLIYLISLLYYMVEVVCVEDRKLDDRIDYIFGGWVMICIFYQLYIEYYQLTRLAGSGELCEYFSNPLNLVDLLQSLIAASLVILTIA